uniref:Uncharacterized protein n=1 Tax=Romanomermis culicivorax TaxID=13658 RepID=A0A915IID3_ROMCU
MVDASLVQHYYVYGFRENDIISLCYVCHDADYAVYTVTEIIRDTLNKQIYHCSPVDLAKTFYVSLYNKTLTMKDFDENSLGRIFFEDYHKEYMIEFTFAFFTVSSEQ